MKNPSKRATTYFLLATATMGMGWACGNSTEQGGGGTSAGGASGASSSSGGASGSSSGGSGGSSGGAGGSSGGSGGSSGGSGGSSSGSGGSSGGAGGASGAGNGTGGDSSGSGGVSGQGGAAGTGGGTGGNSTGGGGTGEAGQGGSGTGGMADGGAAGGKPEGGAAGGGGSGTCSQPIANAKSWDDIKAAHQIPDWIKKAKLGIQIHWGLYAVPAHHNEWFFQHLYCQKTFADWTTQNYGSKSPLSGGPFGYKDFISGFTAAKWDPAVWAKAFKSSGATWVQLSAQHHDRFALWDSAYTKWDAKDMGPHRDLVGDLSKAVRAEGMKFGVSNHIMYGDSFAYCGPNGTTAGNVGPKTPASVSDLYDPAYADFYGPPEANCGINSADSPCSPAKAFCDDWLNRSLELAEKYQLDIEWFDWDGATQGQCQANKQIFVQKYYQMGCAWGKEVTTAGKAGVFPGDDNTATGGNIMIHDFETAGHAPGSSGVATPKSFWLVDDKIISSANYMGVTDSGSWGYVNGAIYRSSSSIISQVDSVLSNGGVLILNVSPMADGTLPQGQIDILAAIGKHLGVAQ